MNIIFLGRSELPKKEKDTEEHQSLMDDNIIDKGFYFVFLWSAIKSFYNTNNFYASVKKCFSYW